MSRRPTVKTSAREERQLSRPSSVSIVALHTCCDSANAYRIAQSICLHAKLSLDIDSPATQPRIEDRGNLTFRLRGRVLEPHTKLTGHTLDSMTNSAPASPNSSNSYSLLPLPPFRLSSPSKLSQRSSGTQCHYPCHSHARSTKRTMDGRCPCQARAITAASSATR